MLASTPLLKDSRYRLDHLISAGPHAHLYKAFDNLAKQPIVILKNKIDMSSTDPRIDSRSLVNLNHDGLVLIADQFQEGGFTYTATEPLAGNASPDPRSAEYLFKRLGVILLAMGTLRSAFPSISEMELSPKTFFATAENKVKLLSTYPAVVVGPPDPLNSPYLPLEKIWNELDHINQKAIYKTYDECSLAVLESPADERSDLYSLGAVFYKLLTGAEPLSAFERAIEMLDTRVDPLTSPQKLNAKISVENSAFIMRLLELRREQRFDSTGDAIASLPSSSTAASRFDDNSIADPMDLLEIPALRSTSTAVPAATRVAIAVPVAVPVAAQVAAKDLFVEKTVIETPVGKKPLFTELVADSSGNPDPKSGIVEAEIKNVPEIAASSPDLFPTSGFLATADVSAGRQKKPLNVAAVFAFAAVLLAAGGWGIFTFKASGTSAVESPTAIRVETPQTADIQPQVPAESLPQPIAASDTQPLPSEEPTADTVLMKPGISESRPRPQIAETKPAKPREKKPAEEKPKKKLTVDDLINDN